MRSTFALTALLLALLASLFGAGTALADVDGMEDSPARLDVSEQFGVRGNADTHWTVVDAPKGSDRKGEVLEGRSVEFTPDEIGSYELRVSGVDGRSARAAQSAAGTKTVTVEASARQPLVPIETYARGPGGHWGIRVGETFYAMPGDADPARNDTPLFQVLTLDRQSLELRENKAYSCDGTGSDDCGLAKDLKRLTSGTIVVAMLHPSSTFPVDAAAEAFRSIGSAPWLDQQRLATRFGVRIVPRDVIDPYLGGGMSIIGNPGLKPGEAVAKAASSNKDNPAAGRISAFLAKDVHNRYTVVPDRFVSYDTRAESGPRFNVIQVGDRRVRADLPDDDVLGGFQMVAADAYTGEVREERFFPTNRRSDADRPDSQSQGQRDFFDTLDNESADRTVFIATVGDAVPAMRNAGGVTWGWMSRAVQKAGGTAHRINGLRPGDQYTLAGSALGDGDVQELATRAGKTAARAVGALAPATSTQRLLPVVQDIHAGMDGKLLRMAYAEPGRQAWPYQDTAAGRTAVRCIGYAVQLGGEVGYDVRAAYWKEGINTTNWNSFSDRIAAVDPRSVIDAANAGKCGEGASIDASEVEAVRKRLSLEARWVANVRAYLREMGSIMSAASGEGGKLIREATEATLKSVQDIDPQYDLEKRFVETTRQIAVDGAKQILLAGVGNAFSSGLDGAWKSVLGSLADPAGVKIIHKTVDKVAGGLVTKGLTALTDLAQGWLPFATTGSGAKAGDKFFLNGDVNSIGQQVGDDLTSRATAATAAYGGLGDILVTDRAKLERFGRMADTGCNPGEEECLPRLNQDLVNELRDLNVTASRRELYATLLPLRYRTERVPNQFEESKISEVRCGYTDTVGIPFVRARVPQRTFKNLADDGAFRNASYSDRNGERTEFWAIVGPWEKNILRKDKPVYNLPKDEYLKRLWEPLSESGDPTKGGLGLDKEDFFLRRLQPQADANCPYNMPNDMDETIGWPSP